MNIGALAATASTTFNLSYLPQFIQIGDPDNADTFNGLTVVGSGKTLIQLTDGAQIRALMQLEQEVLAAGPSTELGSRLWLSSGRIQGESNITIGNAGPGTPTVYANSTGQSSDQMARTVSVNSVVANNNVTFKNFDVLFFLPTNVDRCTVTFMNGFTEDMTTAELQGLYVTNHNTEASGLVNGFVVVDGYRSTANPVREITVYSGSGGATSVVLCSFTQI